ncbi:MAG: hypothetical protein RLZZ347_430 [Candidatus Parcubacteria bacterium]|jgi:uncharacterized membrane protein
MQYNLHPIFVHFPIALLFVYSIIKILPFQKWFPKVSWKHIERALLVVGVGGAFLALATGDTAERLAHANRQLVNAHSTFAGVATWLYGALLLGEILSVYNPKIFLKITSASLQKVLSALERFLTRPLFSRVIAFVALVAISITGLLGGVIVYGTTADPIAGFVLNILGITL